MCDWYNLHGLSVCLSVQVCVQGSTEVKLHLRYLYYLILDSQLFSNFRGLKSTLFHDHDGDMEHWSKQIA